MPLATVSATVYPRYRGAVAVGGRKLGNSTFDVSLSYIDFGK